LVGLEKNHKSILEAILDLVLDFWRLCDKYPWALKLKSEDTMSEIQITVIDLLHKLLSKICKEAKSKEVKVDYPI